MTVRRVLLQFLFVVLATCGIQVGATAPVAAQNASARPSSQQQPPLRRVDEVLPERRVHRNENVSAIARKCHTTASAIREANSDRFPEPGDVKLIFTGESLTMPKPPKSWTVEPGDTVAEIDECTGKKLTALHPWLLKAPRAQHTPQGLRILIWPGESFPLSVDSAPPDSEGDPGNDDDGDGSAQQPPGTSSPAPTTTKPPDAPDAQASDPWRPTPLAVAMALLVVALAISWYLVIRSRDQRGVIPDPPPSRRHYVGERVVVWPDRAFVRVESMAPHQQVVDQTLAIMREVCRCARGDPPETWLVELASKRCRGPGSPMVVGQGLDQTILNAAAVRPDVVGRVREVVYHEHDRTRTAIVIIDPEPSQMAAGALRELAVELARRFAWNTSDGSTLPIGRVAFAVETQTDRAGMLEAERRIVARGLPTDPSQRLATIAGYLAWVWSVASAHH